MEDMLCCKCMYWVNCTKEDEIDGFCLTEDLFTHTKKTECKDFMEGKPMTEKEFEKAL